MTGYVSGDADMGGGSLRDAGSSDVVLAAFAADGAYLWSELLGGTQS